jgi:hypothetical protein
LIELPELLTVVAPLIAIRRRAAKLLLEVTISDRSARTLCATPVTRSLELTEACLAVVGESVTAPLIFPER